MPDNSESVEKVNYSIGEVAEALKVAPSLIRFWEKEFEQLNPRKTKGGTRKYSKEDLALLKTIYQLVKVDGFTLPGAKEMLKLKADKLFVNAEIASKLIDLKSFLQNLKKEIEK